MQLLGQHVPGAINLLSQVSPNPKVSWVVPTSSQPKKDLRNVAKLFFEVFSPILPLLFLPTPTPPPFLKSVKSCTADFFRALPESVFFFFSFSLFSPWPPYPQAEWNRRKPNSSLNLLQSLSLSFSLDNFYRPARSESTQRTKVLILSAPFPPSPDFSISLRTYKYMH